MLEYPKNRDEYKSTYQVNFAGLRHTKGAGDGDIYWMTNMSSNGYPVLSPRKPRKDTGVTADLGFICDAGVLAICYTNNGHAYFKYGNNNAVDLGTDLSVRQMTILNKQIVILPDNKVYNIADGSLKPISASVTKNVTFKRYGEVDGVTYECATIYSNNAGWTDTFNEGDAVTISIGGNDKSSIIRYIDGDNLIFSEYAFDLDISKHTYTVTVGLPAGEYSLDACSPSEAKYINFTLADRLASGKTIVFDGTTLYVDGQSTQYEQDTSVAKYELLNTVPSYADTVKNGVVISRDIPEMDFVCTSSNRVWACKGDTIMASKLGDPFNWNVFDGIATDSFSVDSGTAGDFTGCTDYLGYPMFFKEDRIFKVYGSYPQQYEVIGTPAIGVKEGNNESLAVAGGILFYLSNHGIMSYTGSVPRLVSENLGMDIASVKAGSDGRKLYVSAYDGSAYHMFVYDTFYDMWHREDSLNAIQIHKGDKLYLADNTGKIWTPDGAWGTSVMSWEFITADSVMASFNNKGWSRLTVRSDTSELGDDGYVKVYLKIDNEANWEYVGELTKAHKHIDRLERIMRRGDRVVLKFAGNRPCDIYGISIDYYVGSDF